MSYILDALRRAQAERERGQVPGVHAQPLALPANPGRAVTGSWGLAGLGVLVLAGVLAGLGWRLISGPATQAAAVAAASPGAQLAAPARTSPALQAEVASESPAPTSPAPALPRVVSAPAPRAPASRPAPVVAPVEAPVVAPVERPVEARPLSSLSAEQLREMPMLAVSGSVWSDTPASRFVLINGQVVHEGESAGPGVTLEHIGPRTALVRWRGLRIELPL
jgi:general secretion pathway protein B